MEEKFEMKINQKWFSTMQMNNRENGTKSLIVFRVEIIAIRPKLIFRSVLSACTSFHNYFLVFVHVFVSLLICSFVVAVTNELSSEF